MRPVRRVIALWLAALICLAVSVAVEPPRAAHAFFQGATLTAVPNTPLHLIPGDFDRDGKQDLVIVDGPAVGPPELRFLKGDGMGGFTVAATPILTGVSISAIVAADFNGDGSLDLALITVQGVQLMLGNGDGTFQAPVTVFSETGPDGQGLLVTADFNGDGKPDLAVASPHGVDILTGHGDGTFSAANVLAGGNAFQIVTVGDLNGDGKPDLVVSTDLALPITLLYGRGDGTFTLATAGVHGPNADIAIADFNGDGLLDVAFVNGSSQAIGVSIHNQFPTAPGTPHATAGPLSATVSWPQPVDNGGSPIVTYVVTASPGGAAARTTGATTATVTGLQEGVSYVFSVYPINAAGVSGPPSPQSNAVVVRGLEPDPVNQVNAAPGLLSANVDWSPPAYTGDSPISSYTVTASPGGATVTTVATSATIGGLQAAVAYTFSIVVTNASGHVSQPVSSSPVVPVTGGSYHPLPPTRILDTRIGLGAAPGPIGPGGQLTVPVAGQGGVPASGVSAVVLNVTVTDTTAGGYLTVYPSGPSPNSPPLASNLNWTAGQTVPNLVEVNLGQDGTVTVYNFRGLTDVIFDVAGWVGATSNSTGRAGLYRPTTPARLLDTRTGQGTGSHGAAPLGPRQTLDVQMTNRADVPPTGVSAVVLNVTVTSPTASGYLSVFPTGPPPNLPPLVSNLNFGPSQTIANRVVVPVGQNGQVSFYNSLGSTDVIADVSGWYTDASGPTSGSVAVIGSPVRVFDSRNGFGPLGPGEAVVLQLPAGSQATALVLNVTATDTTAPGYLTVWPPSVQLPETSDLNFTAGQTVPNLVVATIGGWQGRPAFAIFNFAGSTDVVVDVMGSYGQLISASLLPASRAAGGPAPPGVLASRLRGIAPGPRAGP